jgi:dCTP deaminase
MATEHEMIWPFEPACIREVQGQKVISFGTSSYGYDMRVADEFRIFSNVHTTIVDPKNIDEQAFVTVRGNQVVIPPNSFALAHSVERFKIPDNVTCVVLGKSTYARCGIIVNCTPLEAGWEGYVTLEISNTTPLPARIYANEGLAQVLFFQSDTRCTTTYAERPGGGKYQNQPANVVLPKV